MLVRINTYKIQRPVISHMLMMSQCSVLHIIHGDLTAWWYSGNTLKSHLCGLQFKPRTENMFILQ